MRKQHWDRAAAREGIFSVCSGAQAYCAKVPRGRKYPKGRQLCALHPEPPPPTLRSEHRHSNAPAPSPDYPTTLPRHLAFYFSLKPSPSTPLTRSRWPPMARTPQWAAIPPSGRRSRQPPRATDAPRGRDSCTHPHSPRTPPCPGPRSLTDRSECSSTPVHTRRIILPGLATRSLATRSLKG